jgi:hypothetical protein
MNPSLIGPARCNVTRWRLNVVEFFFCHIRSWCIGGPDPGRCGEYSGMLLRVIHRAHKDAGAWVQELFSGTSVSPTYLMAYAAIVSLGREPLFPEDGE